MILNNLKKQCSTMGKAFLVSAMLLQAANADKINLNGVDIKQLIQLISKKTGRNFIVDPRVKGTVSIVTGRDLTEEELYNTFLSVLDVHGFVVVDQQGISRILPKNIAVQETSRIHDDTGEAYGDELVTRVVPVEHVNVLSITTAIRPLARTVQIQHHSQSNSILLSGRSRELDRIVSMIKRMDKVDEKQIEVIPIQYADAKEVVAAIMALNPPTAANNPKAVQETKISADERTNSVLVTGDKATRAIIRGIVARLDVPKEDKSEIIILRLKHATAEEVVKTINELDKGTTITGADGKQVQVGGSTKVSADKRTNSVIISGDKGARNRLAQMIKTLDIEKAKDKSQLLVLQLKYADAKQVVQTINELDNGTIITGADGKQVQVGGSTKVAADERTNSVIISGEVEARQRLAQMIRTLDMQKPEDKSQLLIIKLRFADAEELVKTVNALDSGNIITGADGKQVQAGSSTKVSADKRTNSVIISGEQDARARLSYMIKTLDIPKAPDKTKILIMRLKHADAEQVVKMVNELNTGTSITGTDGKPVEIGNSTKVSADSRTNSVVISGEDGPRDRLAQMIRTLDIKREFNNKMSIIELKYADAAKIVETIKELDDAEVATGADGKKIQISSAIKVSANERTNSVIISGTQESRLRIAKMVKRLDIPKIKEGNTKVIYLRYAQAKELATVLQGVSKTDLISNSQGKADAATQSGSSDTKVDIQADESSNALIITAEPDVLRNLQKVVKRLDIRRAQVMVETIVAEVSSNLSNALGVQFGFNGAGGQGPIAATNYSGAGSSNLNTIAAAVAAGSGALAPGMLVGIGASVAGNQFVTLLNTLATDAATNILSTPTLVTMDNEEAEIVVGQNIPLVTGSYSSTGTGSTSSPFQTIERQDVGLTLKIKPQVNEGTSVRLEIQQEVSSLAASVAGASDLITNKRSINTNVLVDDGQVLVLGGLLENTFRDTREKVPILGNLPIIGRFFRHDATTKDRQYLMVFIHPVIMRDSATADAYTQEKYSALHRGQQNTNILDRGRFGEKAVAFPQNVNDNVTNLPRAQQQQRVQQQRLQQQQRQRQTPRQRQQIQQRQRQAQPQTREARIQQQRNEYKRREALKRQQNELARKRAREAEIKRRQMYEARRRAVAAQNAQR